MLVYSDRDRDGDLLWAEPDHSRERRPRDHFYPQDGAMTAKYPYNATPDPYSYLPESSGTYHSNHRSSGRRVRRDDRYTPYSNHSQHHQTSSSVSYDDFARDEGSISGRSRRDRPNRGLHETSNGYSHSNDHDYHQSFPQQPHYDPYPETYPISPRSAPFKNSATGTAERNVKAFASPRIQRNDHLIVHPEPNTREPVEDLKHGSPQPTGLSPPLVDHRPSIMPLELPPVRLWEATPGRSIDGLEKLPDPDMPAYFQSAAKNPRPFDLGDITSSSQPPRPKLVVLDLNGSLLWRGAHKNGKRVAWRRPYLGVFTSYLSHPRTRQSLVKHGDQPPVTFELFRKNLPSRNARSKAWKKKTLHVYAPLDAMVWSSVQPQNVVNMVDAAFGSNQNCLAGIWSRRMLGLTEQEYCMCHWPRVSACSTESF